MKRPCIEQGCPNLTTATRCPPHAKARERVRIRPTTTERGYGTAHQQARQALAATLPSPCGYCGHLIHPGHRWVAAHRVDGFPEYGYVVAHGPCNERAKRRGVGGV